MLNISSLLSESSTEDGLFGAHAFDTMQRPPKWSHEDPTRLVDSLRDLNLTEHGRDKRAILFVGSPTSSPTRIWVLPAAR
jgi:hypothetical protein